MGNCLNGISIAVTMESSIAFVIHSIDRIKWIKGFRRLGLARWSLFWGRVGRDFYGIAISSRCRDLVEGYGIRSMPITG